MRSTHVSISSGLSESRCDRWHASALLGEQPQEMDNACPVHGVVLVCRAYRQPSPSPARVVVPQRTLAASCSRRWGHGAPLCMWQPPQSPPAKLQGSNLSPAGYAAHAAMCSPALSRSAMQAAKSLLMTTHCTRTLSAAHLAAEPSNGACRRSSKKPEQQQEARAARRVGIVDVTN